MADIKPTILVVDDETSIRESFNLILNRDFHVIMAASGEAALKKVIDEKIDLIYLDIRMSGMNGIETLKRIKEIDNRIEVIMVTAVNDVASATQAVKLGAKDYVVKPFDVKEILAKTRNIIIKSQAKAIKLDKAELLGKSKYIENARKAVDAAIKKSSHILMLGEKGLESEVVASYIANELDKKLTMFNVANDFRMSDLFGLEAGSFTGEFSKISGILEEASGGILFIRNIDLLPKEAQIKLKDALTKKQINREGSLSPIPLDVRLVAETSHDLKERAEAGEFDKDLYNMLSDSIIEIPPLRIRTADIPELIVHYIERFSDSYNKKVAIQPEVLELLTNYPWPGNMTELVNTLEALVISSTSNEISPAELPYDILMNSGSAGRQYTTFDYIDNKMEREHIMDVLKKTGSNKELASQLLGIQQKTLDMKLETVKS
jgi:DNA-binding NtrC family response regulator